MNEQTQELVPVPPNAAMVAAYNASIDDESGLNDTQLKPSTIVLVQNTTMDPGTARPGQFLDTLSKEVFDELVLVPLKKIRTRALFPPGEGNNADPICRSSNNRVPSPFIVAPQSSQCATCPHSQWVDGHKPACSEKVRLLAIQRDTGVPHFLQVSGKSIPPLNQAFQLIKQYVTMNEYQIRKTGEGEALHLHDFYFTVKGQMVTENFRYAKMQFADIKRVANPGEFGYAYEEFVARRRSEVEEEQTVQQEVTINNAVNEVVKADYVQEV